MKRLCSFLVLLLLFVFAISTADPGANSSKRKITIGLIAKISINPVYVATYTGARLAAKEIGDKYGVEVEIDWQSPLEENASLQVATIDRMATARIDGIAVACSDATLLTPAIDNAVAKGVQVLCFDSDAPKSKRFAYCGADDREFGKSLIRELARELHGRGKIAVLAGNKNALNHQRRVQAIREEIKKYPGLVLAPNRLFNHAETPEAAVEFLKEAYVENRDIDGWLLQGSWPLQLKNGLPWEPGTVKAVAGQAVPAELEYVKSGHVQTLVGVNCFQMGYQAIDLLVRKIVRNESPASPLQYLPLTPVTKQNVEEWSTDWKKWLTKEGAGR